MLNPSTMQHLGEVRQREILEQSERDRAGVPLFSLRQRFDIVLIAIGHRLASAASLSDDAEASAMIKGVRGDL